MTRRGRESAAAMVVVTWLLDCILCENPAAQLVLAERGFPEHCQAGAALTNRPADIYVQGLPSCGNQRLGGWNTGSDC